MSYMVQYLHLGSWNYHWKRGISWRPWWYLLRKSSLCRKSYTMWGPQTIAKLVNISPISLWFMAFIAIVAGAYKPTYNWGGSHCRNGGLLFGESAGFILDFPIIVTSYDWLVVYLPLWNIWKSVGIMKFPIYGKYNSCSKPPGSMRCSVCSEWDKLLMGYESDRQGFPYQHDSWDDPPVEKLSRLGHH